VALDRAAAAIVRRRSHEQAVAAANAERDRAYAELVNVHRMSAMLVARQLHERLLALGVPPAELTGRMALGTSHDAVWRATKASTLD
jgi:hypothetical protein